MVTLTVLLAWPIRWTMHRAGWIKRTVTIFAGLLGIGFGVGVLAGAFI
jgi:hypothetical protein